MMSSTSTRTDSHTYTAVDIENVVRKFTTDIMMIAESTGAMSEKEARDYGHDVEVLAKGGYIKFVDITLLDDSKEVRAARYDIVTDSSDLGADRAGGVRWPKVAKPHLRVVVRYTAAYTQEMKQTYREKLNISWGPSGDDISHSGLAGAAGREFSSNSFGMVRKDFK